MARSSIPTWSELFGSLDTKEADSGRSITSPSAYLADLLQVLEDRFNSSDFRNRRPDIPKALKLNGDQSFTLTRQLDIANALSAERIARQQVLPAVAPVTVAGGGAESIHRQPQQRAPAEQVLSGRSALRAAVRVPARAGTAILLCFGRLPRTAHQFRAAGRCRCGCQGATGALARACGYGRPGSLGRRRRAQ